MFSKECGIIIIIVNTGRVLSMCPLSVSLLNPHNSFMKCMPLLLLVQLKKLRHRLNKFPGILDAVNGGAEI